MLIELIAKNAGASQDGERRHYYPSPSGVGCCERAATYHAIGVEPDPFPDRALLVFEDGNWHEELIKDHIRKTVYTLTEWKGKEQRIHIADINGRAMTGEIDGILTDPLGENFLLEIKSINHFGFERLNDAPLDDHRRQANLYLHGIVGAGLEIRKALILYKNKNTSAMKEFIVEYDSAQALADLEHFRQIERWANAKEVPPRPYWFTDWQCEYCRWQKTCWKGYVEEINKMGVGNEMESDYADTARYYKELGAQGSEIDTQREILYKKLKDGLFALNSKEAVAGEYVVKLSAWEQDRIIKELVPAQAIEKVPREKLTVSKLKQKKEKADEKVHDNQAA